MVRAEVWIVVFALLAIAMVRGRQYAGVLLLLLAGVAMLGLAAHLVGV